MSGPLIDIACRVVRETDRAYGITEADDDAVIWVPKSQCEWHATPGKFVGTMVMPEWLAKEKGLI